MQLENPRKFTPKAAAIVIVLGVMLTLAIQFLTNYPMDYTQRAMSPEEFYAEYKIEITDKIDTKQLSDYYGGDVILGKIYVTTYHTIMGTEYEEIRVPYVVPILSNVPTAGNSDWRVVCGVRDVVRTSGNEVTGHIGHIEYADGVLVVDADTNTAITSAPALGNSYVCLNLDEFGRADETARIRIAQLSCATQNSAQNPNETATAQLIFTGNFTSEAMFAQPVDFCVDTQISYQNNMS